MYITMLKIKYSGLNRDTKPITNIHNPPWMQAFIK